jgi:hypothetical protein
MTWKASSVTAPSARQSSDVESYNGMQTVSSVGRIAAGVLTEAGVTPPLTALKRPAKPLAGIQVGPRAAGIYGGFCA